MCIKTIKYEPAVTIMHIYGSLRYAIMEVDWIFWSNGAEV